MKTGSVKRRSGGKVWLDQDTLNRVRELKDKARLGSDLAAITYAVFKVLESKLSDEREEVADE